MRPLVPMFIVLVLALPAVVGSAADIAVPEDLERFVLPLAETDAAQVQRAAEATGGRLVRVDDRADFAIVEAPRGHDLRATLGVPMLRDGVNSAQIDLAVAEVPNDFLFAYQWGPQTLRMPLVWKQHVGSSSVILAIIDSGLDIVHPDLLGVPRILGRDYVEGGEVRHDRNGHGTAMAGIAVATRENGHGIAGMTYATLLVIRTQNAGGSGSNGDLVSAIYDAVDAGAHVISLSLGGAPYWDLLEAALIYAAEHDVLVVAAAGNDWTAKPHLCVNYPAKYDSVIAVGAIDRNLQVAPYSCRGPEIELVAPGSSIISTGPQNAYPTASGTSSATPHVAAVAALMRAAAPDLPASEIRRILQETAMDLGTPGRDDSYGFGLVDPLAALARL